MANDTPNLHIPKLQGNTIVGRTPINNALQAVDDNALPKEHNESSVHWHGWEAGAVHALNDIIRLSSMPSWGYLLCTVAGASGGVEPTCPANPGDILVDGAVRWTLQQIGGTINHQNLSGRFLQDQHTISAITGLQTELDGKVDESTFTQAVDALQDGIDLKANSSDVYTKSETKKMAIKYAIALG